MTDLIKIFSKRIDLVLAEHPERNELSAIVTGCLAHAIIEVEALKNNDARNHYNNVKKKFYQQNENHKQQDAKGVIENEKQPD